MLKILFGMLLGLTLYTSPPEANKVIQKWVVPDGVTKIQVTHKDANGKVLVRKDMDVLPKQVFEVVPLQ